MDKIGRYEGYARPWYDRVVDEFAPTSTGMMGMGDTMLLQMIAVSLRFEE